MLCSKTDMRWFGSVRPLVCAAAAQGRTQAAARSGAPWRVPVQLRGKAKPFRLKPSANTADEARELAELEQRAP